jgi:GTP-binding protein HflX
VSKLIDLTKDTRPERAALVGLITRSQPRALAEELLDELAELTTSAEAVVVDRALQKRDAPQPATYVGRGLVDKIKESITEKEIEVVIFDDPLTPAQQRNLEQALGVKVLDRPRLILDIFARRARTAEAMAQVELAQLQYLLPRLTRAWTHLSRQHGGSIGARGPGETQLEIDRRRVRDKIAQLKKKLKKIDSQRSLRRKGRENLLKISLVGYTNAGKSTLFNKLTKAKVDVANKLFMTLDPTSRIMSTPYPCKVIFTDTVGFVRKLPHELVEAFKSTLEESVVADLLLHVVDCSAEDFQEKIDQTEKVLRQIGATAPAILVYNKVDLAPDFIPPVKDSQENVLVSAVSGQGLDDLRKQLIDLATNRNIRPGAV